MEANKTLQRGLQILELLGEHPSGLELHEIAQSLDIPKSSAHNLVQTLLACRYITVMNKKYALSIKMFEIGASVTQTADANQVLRQYMQEAYNKCNETMHCGVLSGKDVLYIDKIESTQSIRMASHIGVRMPLYATAMGKAFLSCMNDEKINEMYTDADLVKMTPFTISNVSTLLEECRKIRRQGWALEQQENTENVSCVGVAILDRNKNPAYALSISAPSFRMDDEAIARYSQLLLQAKRRIERVLRTL